MTATRLTFRPGAFFYSLRGEWTFQIEQVQGDYVLYTVLETRQKCKAHVDDLSERVEPARPEYTRP